MEAALVIPSTSAAAPAANATGARAGTSSGSGELPDAFDFPALLDRAAGRGVEATEPGNAVVPEAVPKQRVPADKGLAEWWLAFSLTPQAAAAVDPDHAGTATGETGATEADEDAADGAGAESASPIPIDARTLPQDGGAGAGATPVQVAMVPSAPELPAVGAAQGTGEPGQQIRAAAAQSSGPDDPGGHSAPGTSDGSSATPPPIETPFAPSAPAVPDDAAAGTLPDGRAVAEASATLSGKPAGTERRGAIEPSPFAESATIDASVDAAPIDASVSAELADGDSSGSQADSRQDRTQAGEDARRAPVVTLNESTFVRGVESAAASAAGIPTAADVAPGAPGSGPTPDTMHHLVQSIRTQFRNGVGEAVVRLNPEHLGSVSIALRVEHGTVSATVVAEAPNVRRWLETQEPALRQGLAAQGLHLDRFAVEPDERQSQQRREHPPEHRRRDPREDREAGAPAFEVVV